MNQHMKNLEEEAFDLDVKMRSSQMIYQADQHSDSVSMNQQMHKDIEMPDVEHATPTAVQMVSQDNEMEKAKTEPKRGEQDSNRIAVN